MYAIFETGQLLGANRPARMKFACSNADFGTEAKFAAVGELRRSIVQYDR
jgi:hypothetical protein